MDFISGIVYNGEDKDMSFCDGFPTQSPTEKIPCRGMELEVDLQTDFFPFETWYEVCEFGDGGYLRTYQPNTEYDFDLNVCQGCYTFRIEDFFGDGMVGDAGYQLSVNSDEFSGGSFSFSDSFQFGNCTSSCESDEIMVDLDVDIWGKGMELSWQRIA
ncbi:predicted protein [Chaetoceros tenuissimus]|uniref:Uncharacterized protein n=1 Tax=Chaetoceros tenuissimus TaxID=426638 RepID=A0AAD3CW41_9STRA|nr:predicted protein [Chaetoceros tenuissimus]